MVGVGGGEAQREDAWAAKTGSGGQQSPRTGGVCAGQRSGLGETWGVLGPAHAMGRKGQLVRAAAAAAWLLSGLGRVS